MDKRVRGNLPNAAWALLLALSLGRLPARAGLMDLFTSKEQLGQELLVDSSYDYIDGMKNAIKSGADVNAIVTRTGRTALMTAAAKGFPDAVRLLIAEHANVNVSDVFGRTALLDACQEGRAEVVKILLDAGADFRASSNTGETALALAASTGSVATIQALIAAGADVNASDRDGWRPLMFAVMHGHAAAVKALIAAGADVAASTSDKGTTAMTIARRMDWREIEAILEKAAAKKGAAVKPEKRPGGR